jgi:hypothetical protein
MTSLAVYSTSCLAPASGGDSPPALGAHHNGEIEVRTALLIGTNHRFQLPWPRDQEPKQFREMIATTCKQKGVKAIAEEMCVDGLKPFGFHESVCKQVADALHLAHRYCNPSIQEHKDRGIIIDEVTFRHEGAVANKSPQQIEDEIRASHEIRECYWLKQLRKLESWPVLFVCGADHTEPFRALLQADGIVVHVLCTNWTPH